MKVWSLNYSLKVLGFRVFKIKLCNSMSSPSWTIEHIGNEIMLNPLMNVMMSKMIYVFEFMREDFSN
jgi:hypothetical protein